MNIPVWLLVAAGISLAYLCAVGAVLMGAFYYSRPSRVKR